MSTSETRWTETRTRAVARTTGRTLRAAREAKHMTQAEVAAWCGMHRPVYTRIEQGKHVVSLEVLRRVCCALGIRVGDVLDALDLVDWHSGLDVGELPPAPKTERGRKPPPAPVRLTCEDNGHAWKRSGNVWTCMRCSKVDGVAANG